jgi:hypothetical protein
MKKLMIIIIKILFIIKNKKKITSTLTIINMVSQKKLNKKIK